MGEEDRSQQRRAGAAVAALLALLGLLIVLPHGGLFALGGTGSGEDANAETGPFDPSSGALQEAQQLVVMGTSGFVPAEESADAPVRFEPAPGGEAIDVPQQLALSEPTRPERDPNDPDPMAPLFFGGGGGGGGGLGGGSFYAGGFPIPFRGSENNDQTPRPVGELPPGGGASPMPEPGSLLVFAAAALVLQRRLRRS